MSALQHQLIVRDTATLTVQDAFAIIDSIGSLRWAPNSYQAALLNSDRTVVYIVTRDAKSIAAKFTFAPMIRVEAVQWSPDARFLLLYLDHELMVMVFDLALKKFVANLSSPKFNSSKG